MKKAAFLVATLILGLASPAHAFDGLRDRYVYYSNAQMDEVVGYTLIWCDWTATGNGYPTQWYDEEHYDCP